MAHKQHIKEHKHFRPRKSNEEKEHALHVTGSEPPVPEGTVLQHQIGNRAVQRALAQQAAEPVGPSRQALMRQKAAAPAEKAKEKEKKETGTSSGAVWVKKFPTSSERLVDIKFMHSLASQAEFLQRFLSEAQETAGPRLPIEAALNALQRNLKG